MTGLLMLAVPIGAGLVSAGHGGTTGAGSLDGWVDTHGDTMYGTLRTYEDIEFVDDAGWSRTLAMGFDGELLYDEREVCQSGAQSSECGDITSVQDGFGLLGGGADGDVVLWVDRDEVQARVAEPCPDGTFIRAVSHLGSPDCAVPDTYTDEEAVAAVEAAGFTKTSDLAPVATTGSALDLTDLSLDALAGSACTFEGLDGFVTISFTSRGEIGLVCDAGIDFDTDPLHCGGANQPVPALPNANVACVDGAPVLVSCVAGFYDVDGQSGNGCESDALCAPHLTFVDGQCVDLATDPNHCGEPNNPVPEAQNAVTSCEQGSFTLTCSPGWADMDGTFGNGCETPEEQWYGDADGDGYGWHADWIWDFSPPPGYVGNDLDCDDSLSSISPDAPEIAGDGIDNDCDGVAE